MCSLVSDFTDTNKKGEPDAVEQIFNPGSQQAEVGRCEFGANLVYIVRDCLKKTKQAGA